MIKYRKDMRYGKKILSLLLSGMLCLALTGCGGSTDNPEKPDLQGQNQTVPGDYVYLPEWRDIEIPAENGNLLNSELCGGNLYYSVSGLEEGENYSYIGSLNLLEQKEPEQVKQGYGFVNCLFTDKEGSLWCVRGDLFREKKGWFLEKVNLPGVTPESIDISRHVGEDEIVQKAVLDEAGNLYLLITGSDVGIYTLKVISPEGECINEIPEMNYMYSMVPVAEKGVLYSDASQTAMLISSPSRTPEAVKTVTTDSYNFILAGEEDGSLLFTQGNFLARYDWESSQTSQLLTWSDCNILPEQILGMNTLSDGRIAVLMRDWNVENALQIVYLTQTEASRVPEKKTLRLGTITNMNSSELNAAIVEFNKRNSEYKIELVCYSESDWNEGVQKMNQEIISGNGPDLIDLRFANEELETYLEKGVLEDLAPYLESSESISREDFLPNLLDSYTMNGILYTIPSAFQISTLIGKTDEVGENAGWTPEEFMAFAEKQQEGTRLFVNESKSVVLQYLLGKDADKFIDWNAGTGSFEGEEFKRLLEFSNRYDTEFSSIPYEETPQCLSTGTLKLYEAHLNEVEDLQEYRNYYFNAPVTCIGFPAAEGGSGSYFESSGIMLGINSKSEYKEIAWEFISSQLTQSAQQKKGSYGFPSRKDVLESYFAEAMEANWEYDENGEIKTDENGEPIQAPKLTVLTTAPDGTEIETKYYAATQEEVDMLKALITSIQKNNWSNWEILEIIMDEANPYFYGQKQLEEVTANIQSRMNLYISERK